MGEVYRAHDRKLSRDVALKILPERWLKEPDRRARFEREARVLAALNHPNIAAIYGVADGPADTGATIHALILELVDGTTLADRIASGPMPLKDALPLAQQIADALDAAHEKGVVHRDLKPANITVTPDGRVKVLDFGLAKLTAGDGEAPDPFHASTVTMDGTRAGVLLGTAAYMSPEQARGQAVDKRTDIWAFGCVVYELLTGRAAFASGTMSDTIARVLEREPDWTQLPADTPISVRRVLMRCLEKDPRRRLRDIADAQLELSERVETNTDVARARPVPWWRTAALLVAGASILAIGALWFRRPAVEVPRSAEFSFPAPDGEMLELIPPVPSPDGRQIAFVARTVSGERALWIRAVDSSAPRRISGSDGASGAPFWSPDGRFVGFFANGKLKKADAGGGPVLNICSMQANLGATWNRDNIILIAPFNRGVIYRVSAAGGTPEPITTLSTEHRENSHRWPQFLPDGKHFLFTARSDVKEENFIYVGSLDSKAITPLVAAQSNAVLAAPGYLLFAREGTLMAQRFDTRTVTVSGDPVPVVERVAHTTPSSVAIFGASQDGSLVAFQSAGPRLARVTWFDRSGNAGQTVGPEREITEIRLAPDKSRAAVVIPDPDSGNRDIWLLDIQSGSLTRFTSHPANDWQPVWSPTSRELTFASDRNGPSSIYRNQVQGGDEQLLLKMPDNGVFPKGWSADDRFVSISLDSSRGLSSIWALPLFGDKQPFPLSKAAAAENNPVISRDGQWVAYQSNETGSTEIYVKPFTGLAGRHRVSTAGGILPRWRGDGRELFYIAGNGDVMAASLTSDPAQSATPARLFSACPDVSPGTVAAAAPRVTYDVTLDGQSFLFACAVPTGTPQITALLNWASKLASKP